MDRELTLGKGLLLSLFFGLACVCALFFVLGYSFGKSTAQANASVTSDNSDAGTDSGKESGVIQPAPQGVVLRRPRSTGTSDAEQAIENGDSRESDSRSATGESAVPGAATAVSPDKELSSRALSAATLSKPPQLPNSSLSPTGEGGYIVQVAAVSKLQDAQALVGALKKKQYAVFIAANGADSLFHVQVGPLNDNKDAEAIRTRLIADGYNPIIKK